MKLKIYWSVYALVTGGLTVVGATGALWALQRGWLPALLLSLTVLGLIAFAVRRRLGELRSYRHLPGPKPSFFLGNLPSLLAQEHGGRDQALLALHRVHGPMVRLHLAWGSRPFVSMSKVSDSLHRKDVDSNRRADGEVLGNSLMGLKLGEQHRRHREELNPVFTPAAVMAGAPRTAAVSRLYLKTWKSGTTRHGSLKVDLHHWSAHALAVYLCGEDWEPGGDLTEYLAAIAALEETISVDAFHPWFAKWCSPALRARARNGYRYLFGMFAQKLEQRRRRGGEIGDDALGRLVGQLEHWSHKECVEEMISLVAGGTDAMSYTTAQALVLLSSNPSILAQVRNEMAEAPTPASSPAIRNVIFEAMRLFPAVPFSSKVVPASGVIEDGLFVPPGTNLMWMKTAIGPNDEVFHDPHQFLPSRYTGQAEQRESLTRALPFGAGPRHCPGRSLAEFLCGSLLTAIVAEFEIEAIDLVDVQFSATVSVTPSAVPVCLHPRSRHRSHHEVVEAPAKAPARCPFGYDVIEAPSPC